MIRVFEDRPATRGHVPLLIGLMGPSGSGKTYSALRLAEGIRKVAGGDTYMIDTESRRALHYADRFDFRHIEFAAPFGSLDYLAVLQFAVGKGAGVVIVDSMSHEHESQGGLLDSWESEIERLAGNDYAKRERVKMLAIQKPKQHRRKLISGLLQLNANFIFCFRAKDTSKPMKVAGKTEIVPLGYMPIAGEEFVFEMTVNCLLLPGAQGVPTWQSENVGERSMMKLPEQFKALFSTRRPLDEQMGKDLATWARGDVGGEVSADLSQQHEHTASARRYHNETHSARARGDEGTAVCPAAPDNTTPSPPTSEVSSDPAGDRGIDKLRTLGDEAASRGMELLQIFWRGLTPAQQHRLGGRATLDAWKLAAEKVSEADIFPGDLPSPPEAPS